MNDDELENRLADILCSAYPAQLTVPQILRALRRDIECQKSAVNRVLYHRLLGKGLALKKTKENAYTPLWEATSVLVDARKPKSRPTAQESTTTCTARLPSVQPAAAAVQQSSSLVHPQLDNGAGPPQAHKDANSPSAQGAVSVQPPAAGQSVLMQPAGGIQLVPQYAQQNVSVPVLQQCPHLQLVTGMMPYAAGTWCAACGAGQVPVASYALSGSPGAIYDASGYGQWVSIDPNLVPNATVQAEEVSAPNHQQTAHENSQGNGTEQHIQSSSGMQEQMRTLSGLETDKNSPGEQDKRTGAALPLNSDRCISPIVQKQEERTVENKVPMLRPEIVAKDSSTGVSLDINDSVVKSSGSPQGMQSRFGGYKTSDPILASWLKSMSRSSYTK